MNDGIWTFEFGSKICGGFKEIRWQPTKNNERFAIQMCALVKIEYLLLSFVFSFRVFFFQSMKMKK